MSVKFIIKEGNESLTSHTGLALIGALLRRTKLKERINAVQLVGCKAPKITHSNILLSMTGLICLGKPDYEAIEPFRNDPFFVQSLGLEVCPSAPALRQRIDLVKDSVDSIIKEESASLVRCTAPQISPVETSIGDYVPLDLDVSPFDNSKTNKEGVSRTYKGHDGFAPNFAYLGREGYLVNVELREGKQHCQKGTPEFLEAAIRYSKSITDQSILVRLDSGNDSKDNLSICQAENVDLIIKRNLRKEDPKDWLDLAMETGVKREPRKGKVVWRGETFYDFAGNQLPVPIVFEVIERSIKKGQALIFPEIEVNTYWTTLGLDANETIFLYQDHGTSEQFHSEIKTDMDLERLPSALFESNAVILLLGMLAYNLLRLCGQESLREDNGNIEKIPGHRKKAQRRRLRTVMLDLIYIAGRVIHTSRRWFISFGKVTPWQTLWKNIYQKFTADTA